MTVLVSVPQAASILGLTNAIITSMIDCGQLEALIVPNKKRKTIRIYMDSVEKFRRGERTEQKREAV